MWSDFCPAFVIIAMFSVFSIGITKRMPPVAGDEIARRRQR
jgi:hypothetical protein